MRPSMANGIFKLLPSSLMTCFPVTPSISLYSGPVTAPVALIMPEGIAIAVCWLIVVVGGAATREGGVVVLSEVRIVGLKGPPVCGRRYGLMIDIYVRAAHRIVHCLGVFRHILLYGHLLYHSGSLAD